MGNEMSESLVQKALYFSEVKFLFLKKTSIQFLTGFSK